MRTSAINEMKVSFPSASANESFARAAVAAFAAQLDPTVDELSDVRTAVSEAVTNCIVHAYRDTIGEITLTVRIYEGRRLVIQVKDKGVGIPDVERARQALEDHKGALGFDHVDVKEAIAKVSIVGAGMVHNPGVAAKMFEALYNAGINISMISTSEIKVSVLVDLSEADRAVQVIHNRFFNEFGNS